MLSATEKSIRGKLGAYSLHAQGLTNTAPARKAFNQRFLDEVDPDRTLPETERNRRATAARKAYYARLALKSAQARRRKAGRDA